MSVRILFVFALLLGCTTTNNTQTQTDKLVVQGNELAKEGLLREASQAYKNALAENPNNSVARRNLGIMQLKLKNYRVGVVHLEKIINKYETDFDTNFWLAEGLRASDRYADAIYRYKKALSIKEGHSRSLKALAWSYYKTRYYSEALNIAKQLQKKSPNDVQTAVILARILIKLDQPQQALAQLGKIKGSVKEDGLAYLQSVEGDAYLAMDRCTDAMKSYKESLRVQPLLPGPLLGLGHCNLSIGKTDQAISYLERAVRIKPNFTEAVYTLAKAYEGTDQKKAVKNYKLFRKLAVKDPEYVDRLGEAKSKISKLSLAK
jgi:tetratricopeptide (TPR) repeat protein